MSNLVPLSAMELKQQVNLVHEVMKGVMKEGTHFGVIPGCPKPSLFKPGAEKLSLTFHLRPIIDNASDVRVDDLGNGHREVTVYCHILTSSDLEIATGVGSCSTMESKYRYRGGLKIPTGEEVPKEYWNLKKAGELDKAKELIGGSGYSVAKIDDIWQICEFGEKMENPDIADNYNTVLKMAKKRAYVDGILSATAASDIFVQDAEDLPPEAFENDGVKKTKKEPVKPPQSKKTQSTKPAAADNPPPPDDKDAPQQGELIPNDVPGCESCGLPLGKDMAAAQAVIDWCKKKNYGAALCRNCQPK